MNPTKYLHHLTVAPAVTTEVKATAEGKIEGYASTYGGPPDRHSDIIMPGAFARSLETAQGGQMPVMLWSHRQEEPIGRWTAMHDAAKGLYVEGVLNLKTERGREAYEHIRAGDAGGLSIGFNVPEGGREYAGKGVFHLKSAEVLEISVVAIPANPAARISTVKNLGTKADAIEMLRECGLSKKAATRFAGGGWPALNGEQEDHHKAIQLAEQIDAAIQLMRQQ